MCTIFYRIQFFLSYLYLVQATYSLVTPKAVLGALVSSSIAFGSLFTTEPLFETAQDIPAIYFKEKRSIRSIVDKVSDGDTYKVRHITNGKKSRLYNGPIKYHTIIVRVAAVDTPETAKQGNPGQPFAEEAKQFAISKLLGNEVKVKLLSRDQYGRVVAIVKYQEKGWFGLTTERDISEELLKSGLAVVYRQGGAQYDGSKDKWIEMEETARKGRKGLWLLNKNLMQTPAEYKRSVKSKSK